MKMDPPVTGLHGVAYRCPIEDSVKRPRMEAEANAVGGEDMVVASRSKKAKKIRTPDATGGSVVDGTENDVSGTRTSECKLGDGEEEEEVEEEEEGSPPQENKDLSKEQRMRMELNKGIARAKRNLRACEEFVAESGGDGLTFPNFEGLLIEPTWVHELGGQLRSIQLQKLHKSLNDELSKKCVIYPPPALVFNAFNTCPFDKVKVVILGQDPYHGANQAMGLCFSVPVNVKIPSSLVNVFKEIQEDVGCPISRQGNLEKWAHQGVLLLNAYLTVREARPYSHAKRGWDSFTDEAIRVLSRKRTGIVFLLWGNSAMAKQKLIDTTKHHVLTAAHPSGLSAHRGFFKCKHFSKTNELLEKAGKLPIDWSLP